MLPFYEFTAQGDLVLRQLPALLVECLLSVPYILADEDEGARSGLFPDVYPDHEDKQEEWERYSVPELHALFAKQGEIVRADLRNLEPERQGFGYRLTIPETHRTAWMAALNAARLMVAGKYELGAEDMDRDYDFREEDFQDGAEEGSEHEEPPGRFERELALYRINLLADIEGMIIDAGEAPEHRRWGPGESFEAEDG